MPGIKVTIGGSVAGLKAALNQAESQVQKFSKKVKGFFGGFGGMLAGAGLGLGFKKIVDDLDNMSKRSRALGVTVEEMQKLEYVANSTNMGFDQLSGGMAKAMQVVSEAMGGNDKAVQKLQRLNVEVGKLNGANAYQIMEAIAAGAAQIADPVERVSALMDVLGAKIGKNAQFFTDFFDRVKSIEEAGGIISNEDAQAAEQINQSLTEAAKAIRAILVDTGALAKLAQILDNYAAYFGEDKLRERTGVKKSLAGKVVDQFESNALIYTIGGGWALRPTMNALGVSLNEGGAEALPLTASTTRKATPGEINAAVDAALAAAEEDDDTEYIEAMNEMSAAVDNLASATEATAPGKQPRSAMRGGDDPTFTDALRRIGGDAGGVYRQGDNYARTTAEATKAMADNLDAMNRNGINLRG